MGPTPWPLEIIVKDLRCWDLLLDSDLAPTGHTFKKRVVSFRPGMITTQKIHKNRTAKAWNLAYLNSLMPVSESKL